MTSLGGDRHQQPAGQVVGAPAQASRNEADGADGAATAGVGQAARFTLAGIRVLNGGLALIASSVIIGRFDQHSADGSLARRHRAGEAAYRDPTRVYLPD